MVTNNELENKHLEKIGSKILTTVTLSFLSLGMTKKSQSKHRLPSQECRRDGIDFLVEFLFTAKLLLKVFHQCLSRQLPTCKRAFNR